MLALYGVVGLKLTLPRDLQVVKNQSGSRVISVPAVIFWKHFQTFSRLLFTKLSTLATLSENVSNGETADRCLYTTQVTYFGYILKQTQFPALPLELDRVY